MSEVQPEAIGYMISVGTKEEFEAGRAEVGLTVDQIATILKLSISGVRMLIKAGELVAVTKIDRVQLFRASHVDAIARRRGVILLGSE